MEARILLALASLVAIAIGSFCLLYVFAFCSMVEPSLQGWDRWSEILGRMFDFKNAGRMTGVCLVWIAISVCTFAGSIVSIVKEARKTRREN